MGCYLKCHSGGNRPMPEFVLVVIVGIVANVAAAVVLIAVVVLMGSW